MKKIILAFFAIPALSLASGGEGGPGFNNSPLDGKVILNCNSIRIYRGVSRSPLVPSPMLSSYGPVTNSYVVNGVKIYENSQFQLSVLVSDMSFGTNHAFSARLVVNAGPETTVTCFKGPSY